MDRLAHTTSLRAGVSMATDAGIHIKSQTAILLRDSRKTEYCGHYLMGRCGYGAKCQYSHQRPPQDGLQQDGYVTKAANSTRGLKCPDYPNCIIGCTPEKEYCHHFFKHDNCRFGDECRLSHNHPTHVVQVDCKHYPDCPFGCGPNKIDCHRYTRRGECPNGNKCHRSHSPPAFRGID